MTSLPVLTRSGHPGAPHRRSRRHRAAGFPQRLSPRLRPAAALRAALDKGGDPQAERDRQRTEAAPAVTFKYAVAQYIAAHKPGGSNEKHAQQLENTLATYA